MQVETAKKRDSFPQNPSQSALRDSVLHSVGFTVVALWIVLASGCRRAQAGIESRCLRPPLTSNPSSFIFPSHIRNFFIFHIQDLAATPPQCHPPLPIKICGHRLAHADLGSSYQGSGPLTTLGPSAAATYRVGERKQPHNYLSIYLSIAGHTDLALWYGSRIFEMPLRGD